MVEQRTEVKAAEEDVRRVVLGVFLFCFLFLLSGWYYASLVATFIYSPPRLLVVLQQFVSSLLLIMVLITMDALISCFSVVFA